MKIKIFLFTLMGSLSLAPSVFSCDFCSLYLAQQATRQTSRGFHFGVAEQFTHMASLQFDGVVVPNTVGQYLDSSITQFFFGYGFNDRWGIQVNLPLIDRSFRRPENGAVEQESVTGIGDMTLSGRLTAPLHRNENSQVIWNFIGGIKFPTGSSSFLAEELTEGTEEEGGSNGEADTLPPSGIHGHDLALGSGSFDGLIGTDLYARWKRFFFTVNAQLSIRSRGSFGYQYANEGQWSGGPGAYLLLNHAWTLAVQARTSGESKGLDNLAGVPAPDTGITSVYMGPEILMTWKNHLSATMGADLPLLLDNTDLQVVPNYRIRVALTGHF